MAFMGGARILGRRFICDSSKLRNLGIIAHIDAGKTTTTERMLYYAGVTKRLGNVDSGNTVTDFLEAERERGITIQSAAITFDWSGHQINLIDTPGHADFNFEVVRSLRVLDGAVTILDGVAGVEALTEKVWALADQLGIPRILYVNKMDCAGAGFSRTVREAVSKLRTPVALLNIPYFEDDKFAGIIDVLQGVRIEYKSKDGKQVDIVPCKDTPQAEEAVAARGALIDQLSEFDADVLSEFVDNDSVKNETLIAGLRRATLANEIVPVLCGSSFRNIGIQPLLDTSVQYLPSPFETSDETTKTANANETVRMLAFKVRQDPQRGMLVYIRVYSGVLKKNATIYNTARCTSERVTRLLRMQADEAQEITSAAAGDIAVIGGTTGIRTGDTLVAHPTKLNGVSALSKAEKGFVLLPIPIPPPVFVSRIIPKGPGDVRDMKAALEILLQEDPSLHLSYDEEAGQYLLSGMGELHLEIATNRLVDDFKARVVVGEVMITYKETLASGITTRASLSGPDNNGIETYVSVEISPCSNTSKKAKQLIDSNSVVTAFRRHSTIDEYDVAEQVAVGITPVLAQGGLLGRHALFGLEFKVEVTIGPDAESPSAVAALVRKAAATALSREQLDSSSYELLEPLMDVQVSVPQSQVGTVMNDLTTTRRGSIGGMSEASNTSTDVGGVDYHLIASNMWAPVDHTMYMSKHENQRGEQVQVSAKVPLRKMVGYLSSLQSMTQGRATFEMSFSEFAAVAPQDVDEVLN